VLNRPSGWLRTAAFHPYEVSLQCRPAKNLAAHQAGCLILDSRMHLLFRWNGLKIAEQ
jgi:hypothetical protein